MAKRNGQSSTTPAMSTTMVDANATPNTKATTKRPKKKQKVQAAAEPPPAAEPLAAEPPPAAEPPAKAPKQPRKKRKAEEAIDDADSTISSTVVSTATTTTVAGRPKKKRAKKPSMRTPSNYVLFSLEKRKEITAQNPDLSLGEISKLCGAAWRALAASERAPYDEKANALKEARKQELLLTQPPPKTKRTPSSYLLFAMEHRTKVMAECPTMKIGDCSKLCGAAWKALDGPAKQVYIDTASELKAAAATAASE